MRKIIASFFRRRVNPPRASAKDAEAPPSPSRLESGPPQDSAQATPDAENTLEGVAVSTAPQQDNAQDPKDTATMWKRRNSTWRWVVDVLIYLIVLGLLAAVEYGYMPSPRTGFYCNDPKINFKFNGDTITVSILLCGSFIAPLIALWCVEATLAHVHRGGGLWLCVKRGVRPTARWYREFVLGLGVVMFVTDAMKLLIAEPRPHFLDTCRPDAAQNCSSSSPASQWIDDFSCTNQKDSAWAVRDSMRSFPSGHTSISVYTALFVMVFLRRRMLSDVTMLLVPALQGLFLLWALVCSLSRITDHRHHWWDVLAGSVVGVISAIYTVHMFCDDFCPHHHDDGDDSLSSSHGSSPGLGHGHGGKGTPTRPLLNGHVPGMGFGKDCACSACPTGCPCPDSVPARRLMSSSSSCASAASAASSLTVAEERELREVSTTS